MIQVLALIPLVGITRCAFQLPISKGPKLAKRAWRIRCLSLLVAGTAPLAAQWPVAPDLIYLFLNATMFYLCSALLLFETLALAASLQRQLLPRMAGAIRTFALVALAAPISFAAATLWAVVSNTRDAQQWIPAWEIYRTVSHFLPTLALATGSALLVSIFFLLTTANVLTSHREQ